MNQSEAKALKLEEEYDNDNDEELEDAIIDLSNKQIELDKKLKNLRAMVGE